MGIFSLINKQFDFLNKKYSFIVDSKQKYGSYYYICWSNTKVKIKIVYDMQGKESIKIFVYDANSLGTIYDVDEYADEFVVDEGSAFDKICCASKWLKDAISRGIISI